MLRLFRKNDPYLLLIIAAFVFVSRGLVLLLGIEPVEVYTLSENLGRGFAENPSTYIGSDFSAGPLYTFFCALLAFVFNHIKVVSVVVAGVLVFLQALIINTTFQKNSAFQESNFVPAALYVLFLSTDSSLFYLSPSLMASTFILLAIDKVFVHLKYRGTEENILTTGFLIGLAAMCYLPTFFLLPVVIIIYLLYSGTLTRRYFLMLYGFCFSVLLFWIYFLAFDTGKDFLSAYFTNVFQASLPNQRLINQLLITFGLGAVLSLYSAGRGFRAASQTNHQILMYRSMVWLMIMGISFLWFDSNSSVMSLIPAVTPFAFFSTHFLLTRSKRWFSESVFLLVLSSSLLLLFL